MSPLEMRLIKDKLDLVARVLSSSDDAYRHVDVILDLTNKLGYRDNDSAHIRVLAMLTESAMQKPDFDQAGEICERIVDAAIRLQRQQRQGKEVADSDQAVDICWKTCSQLGKQSEYSDIPRKMSLLGRALQFCPPEAISELLVVWRRVEDGQVRLDEAARNRHEPLIFKKGHHRNTSTGSTTSVTSSSKVPQDSAAQLLGSRRAAKAASRLNQVAHDFSTNFNLRPLQTGVSSSAHREESSPARSESSDRAPRDAFVGLGEGGAEIKQQARRALVKGVGWLIGAGEEELQDVE
jgi:neuroblastoma-amplified sequence